MISILYANALNVQILPQTLSSARRLIPADSPSSFSSSSSLSASLFASDAESSSEEVSENYDSFPRYSSTFTAEDLSTGDEKQQDEKRDGDSSQGQNPLLESNESGQILEFTDDSNEFSSILSRDPKPDDHQQSAGIPSSIENVAGSAELRTQYPKALKSSPSASQSEQRLTRPQALNIARRFPLKVLGQRVPTSIINHSPTLFNPNTDTTTFAQNGAGTPIRNAGNTVIQRIRHPQTIIEHRPATTLITQLAPGRRTISLLHDILN
ncbi:unnamed protein product [Hermetia illucens]|uniref:Uncharacterized protein n=2 Tax=Hermetia illucens TaxID=343691 RepID=A0A7R8UED2_HERIL|nr:unnamed protein product [Hermetia illucens]